MGTTKIHYTSGNNNWNGTPMERSVSLLPATELDTYMKVEGTTLSSTVLNLLKIAYINGSAVTQWTRSPSTTYTDNAWYLITNGGLNNNSCITTYGSHPTFTLPSTPYVSDDGSVSGNTAPGAPSSITYPSSINGGSTITVEWGAASDADDNLEGYKVERSVDGGSIWTQIYQGSARSTTNNVAFGTASVMFRVKAYDTEGRNSDW